MLKYFLAAAALVVAGVPAAYGLAGNDSFTRDIPVRVPEQAQTETPTVAPTAGDDDTPDQGRGEVEPGDDHGGDVPRDLRTEDGDDHGVAGHEAEPGDDDGGHHAEPGDDHGGTGGDTSGSTSGRDDSGSGDDGSGRNRGSDDGGTSGGGSDSSGGGGSDDGSGHN